MCEAGAMDKPVARLRIGEYNAGFYLEPKIGKPVSKIAFARHCPPGSYCGAPIIMAFGISIALSRTVYRSVAKCCPSESMVTAYRYPCLYAYLNPDRKA